MKDIPQWPDNSPQRAFVEGARWWQYKFCGSTMFPSEREIAEKEAANRYGDSTKMGVDLKFALTRAYTDLSEAEEDHVILPQYNSDNAAGIDLRAIVLDSVVLRPGEKMKIATGVMVEITPGYVGIIIPRSGKGSQGFALQNTAGVIDPDYRGEIFMNVVNTSNDYLYIHPFERVCQLLIVPCPQVALRLCAAEELGETARNDGGFGSTGTV